MKANEFIKKFGWGKAKEVSSFTSSVCEDPTHFDSDLDIYVHFDDFKGVMDESDVCIRDLKRLVESHDLVEKYKNRHGCIRFRIRWGQFRHGDTQEYNDRLKQAILDVESCQ